MIGRNRNELRNKLPLCAVQAYGRIGLRLYLWHRFPCRYEMTACGTI